MFKQLLIIIYDYICFTSNHCKNRHLWPRFGTKEWIMELGLGARSLLQITNCYHT